RPHHHVEDGPRRHAAQLATLRLRSALVPEARLSAGPAGGLAVIVKFGGGSVVDLPSPGGGGSTPSERSERRRRGGVNFRRWIAPPRLASLADPPPPGEGEGARG